MLQQTQVKTVIPYFNTFIKRFKNIETFSRAKKTTVLKYWEGLGFYSRAKNLHESAKIIQKYYGGHVPKNFEELKSFPGIGDYTASMIMAIVNNKPYIALDGNVKRLFKRFFLLPELENKKNLNLIKNKKKYFIHKKRHGDLAQALIEIGALVCKPKKPHCIKCPINNYCLSRGTELVIKKTKKIKKVNYIALCYYRNNRLLVTTKNPGGFLKDMITVPMIKKNNFYKKRWKKNFKLLPSIIKHNISNLNLNIRIAISDKNIYLPEHFWIYKNNFKNYPIPVLTKKIFQAININ